MKSLAVVAVALTVGGLGSGVAQAESAPGCSSTVQIGSTAYAKYQGATAASVTQFKGCGKNWAYTFVWDQFLARHLDFHLITYVVSPTGDPVGLKESGMNVRELWSSGTDTLAVCTRAEGIFVGAGLDDVWAETDQRC